MTLHSSRYQLQLFIPTATPSCIPPTAHTSNLPPAPCSLKSCPKMAKIFGWSKVGRRFLKSPGWLEDSSWGQPMPEDLQSHCPGLAVVLQLWRASTKLYKNGVLVEMGRMTKVLHPGERVMSGLWVPALLPACTPFMNKAMEANGTRCWWRMKWRFRWQVGLLI